MSLRARIAIAVGAVVFVALTVVAAVVYPAVGANLRRQEDESLVQVAKKAPTIAAKLKQAGAVGQLVPFGSTQLQILPDATVGPTNGFVDVTAHQASRRGTRLPLTKTEFALLELFLRNPHRVLSRTQIFESVWGYDFGPESNALWVYISYLRRKMGEPRLIQTVRGIGYVLREGK